MSSSPAAHGQALVESPQIDQLFRGRANAASSSRPLPTRWAQLLAGLFLFGVAISLMIRSELGLGPWDAFHVGLHRLRGMSGGVASIVAGIVIVLARAERASGRQPGLSEPIPPAAAA